MVRRSLFTSASFLVVYRIISSPDISRFLLNHRSLVLKACDSLWLSKTHLKRREIRQVGVKVEIEVSAFASAGNGDIRAHEANGEGGEVRRVHHVVAVQIAE